MVEQDKKPDALELEFRALEAKCVEAIRAEWPEGAGCEMGVSEDDSFIVVLDDDGFWHSYRNTYPELDSDIDILVGLSKPERTFKLKEFRLKGDELDRFDNKFFCLELGKASSLNALLMVQAALDDGFRARVREQGKESEDEASKMMSEYVEKNWERLTQELMESMQDLIDSVGHIE